MATYPFQTALVTGASSGIGAEMARQLGEAGVPTVLVARRGDRLRELAARHDGFEVLEADLLTDAGRDAVTDRIADDDAPIDLVVNNAGFGSSGMVHELDPARLADEVELNVKALTVLSTVALATMRERDRGWLLNVSSVASFQAGPGLAVYSATKAFVTSFTEAVHEEMRGTNVAVSALCPGLTKTEFQAQSNTEAYEERIPGFMWTDAEMVAREGLDGVARNRTLIVPGAVYKGAQALGSVTPRFVARRLSGLVGRT
ncbi:MAG: SDR family oxidoreductase [Actinomycetota bacterium]